MATQMDCFDEFLRKVEPLIKSTPLYRSLELACVAARRGSEWILIAGKAVLSTEPCSSDPRISRLVRVNQLLALSGRIRVETVNNLVINLRESWVIRGMGPDTMPDNVRLTLAEGAGGYSWSQPRVCSVDTVSNPSNRWNRVLSMWGSGPTLSSLLSYASLQEIDSQLRRSTPGFNGFDALCSKLNLPPRRNQSLSSSFELSAELPARFVVVQTKSAERTLEIDIECVGIPNLMPDLMIDWLPKRDFHRVENWQQPEPKGNLHHVSVALPDEAAVAELMLSFPGIEAADTVRHDIVRESTLLRIVNFFDPGQTRLTSYLFEKKDSGGNAFELGVARLLSTAGFVVLWFGKASKDGLSDLVAYWRSPLGEEYLILAECTIKDHARKLSDLADRGKQMSQAAGLGSDRFLPVLFTRTEVTEPDVAAAAQRGVVLCDARKLKDLQQQIISGASPLELYGMLRSLCILL